MRNIAAVVVTYNRIELLKECIEALRMQNQLCDIIAINNASTDGTKEWLMMQYDIKSVHLEKNTGGAGGFNTGIRMAAEMGYEYIWIMDDDTIPNRDCLRKLMIASEEIPDSSLASDLKFGFIASRIIWTDGTPCKMNEVSLMQKDDSSTLQRAASATFVSLLFDRKAVMREGLPISEYFIWGDDKEYTLRMSKKYPCYYCPDSIAVHKMATNSGSNIKTDEPKRVPRYFYAYRNDLATAKKGGAKDVAIYFAAFILNTLRVIFSLYPAKGARLKAMFKGMIAGISFHPDIEYISRINNK